MATASPCLVTESNEVLKLKFKKLHKTVVDNVNPVSIINFLFQEDVIGPADMRALLRIRDDPQQQSSELLALLHTSEHPQAFIQLYLAIKEETNLQWLIDRVDNFTDHSLIDLLQQIYISEPTVGQVVHILPEGPPVWGVTSLGNELFLVRDKELDQVEVYDVITYRLLRCLTVPNAGAFIDMASCERYRCIYLSDHSEECIHRLDRQGAATRWPVNDEPSRLSVNKARNVLVTCRAVRNIKEFSTHGNLIRVLTLPNDVINPRHAIQLTSGQFVVCHGRTGDPVHRVCLVSSDGCQTVHSHGGQPGSDTGEYNVPAHLAVDDNEFVFVADVNNCRVTLLSPRLDYVRQVEAGDELKWRPGRLHLDSQRRRLYVAENELKDSQEDDQEELDKNEWNENEQEDEDGREDDNEDDHGDNQEVDWIAGRVVVFGV